METYDLGIVGGGPVGGYIAGRIAEKGFKVAVFEKNNEIGKILNCAGLVTPRVFDLIDINKEKIDIEMLTMLCPFLSTEKVDELVDNMLDDEGVEKVFKGIAPFLSSDKCEEIFL